MSKLRIELRKESSSTYATISLLSQTAENLCNNVDWYLVFKYFPTDNTGSVGRLTNTNPFGVYKNNNLRGDVSWCFTRSVVPAPDTPTSATPSVSYLTSVVCHIRKLCYGEPYSLSLSDLYLNVSNSLDVDLTKISKEGKVLFVANIMYQKIYGSSVTFSWIDLGNDKSTRDFFLQMFATEHPTPYLRPGAPETSAGKFVSGITVN